MPDDYRSLGSDMAQQERAHAEALKGAVPFRNHDARRATLRESGGPLDDLARRVQELEKRMSNDMVAIADQLNGHADRVHGAPPGDAAEPAGRSSLAGEAPYYGSGALATLADAVSVLEGSYAVFVQRLAVAAGRNSTLA